MTRRNPELLRAAATCKSAAARERAEGSIRALQRNKQTIAFQVRHAWLGVPDTGQTSQNDDQGPVVGHVLLRGRSEVGELSPAGEQEMWVALSGLTPPSEITEAAHGFPYSYCVEVGAAAGI